MFDRILTTTFSERDASNIFKTFMTALSQIHYDRGMINIDLKTENLVFSSRHLMTNSNDSSKDDNNEQIVKIIDFGMAVSLWDRTGLLPKYILCL